MFFGDSIYEVFRKSIVDGLYGLYKQIENLDCVIFEYHYTDKDFIGPEGPVDLKEAIDKNIEGDHAKEQFKGHLKKVEDNKYIFSGLLGHSTKEYEFSFVKEDRDWVERSIVLK